MERTIVRNFGGAMKRAVLVLAMIMMTIAGCGVDWFPETHRSPTTPDAFSFTLATNVTPGSTVTSNAITVTGITAAAPISVSGDPSSKYSINSAAFTNISTGTVTNGQTVTVQHTAASGPSQSVSTTLTIGGVSATFTSTTVPVVLSAPFTTLTNQATSASVVSNSVTVTGVNPPFPITVTNGQFQINGTGFTTSPGSAQSGDTIQLSQITASAVNTSVTTTITISGVPFTFTTTTGP